MSNLLKQLLYVQEWAVNAVVSLMNKSIDEVVKEILLHPSATKSIIAAICPQLNGIAEQSLSNISQMLADNITLVELYHEVGMELYTLTGAESACSARVNHACG